MHMSLSHQKHASALTVGWMEYCRVKHSHCYARGSQPHHPVGESISPVIFMDFDFRPRMSAYAFTNSCNYCSDYIDRFSYGHDGSFYVSFERGSAKFIIEHFNNDYETVIYEDRFSSFKVKCMMVEGDIRNGSLEFLIKTEFGEIFDVSIKR